MVNSKKPMTVQDMIDLLNKVDDKNRPVAFSTRWWDDGDFHSVNLDITNIVANAYLDSGQKDIRVKLGSNEDVVFNTSTWMPS